MRDGIMLASMVVRKPSEVFDREREWKALVDSMGGDRSHLSVVWGPRRAGKSYLLSALCEAIGGLYVQAVRGDRAQQLAHLGAQLAGHLGVGAALRIDDWLAAVDLLIAQPKTRVVVLDEFPYFVESEPALPSIVQAAVDRRRVEPASHLILCGSAISQMTRLLASDAPLYRRAGLAMALQPFDFATAVRFWGLERRLADALVVHAIVGGLPGYHAVLGTPGRDVDRWIVDRVLNPYGVLFNEDDLALAVDVDVTDANVYRSVLAAVANGARTATAVAQATGRKATSLVRQLDRLVAAGLLVRTPDPLRAKRALLDVGDPFLRFHFAIIRPNKHLIALGRAREVWERSRAAFGSQVLGPHLEQLGRSAMFGLGVPGLADVGATTLYDAKGRSTIELDIVGVDGSDKVVVIGEAKATSRGVRDLARLERARDLLPAGRRAGETRLVLVAPSFDPALRRMAGTRRDVHLVDAAVLARQTT